MKTQIIALLSFIIITYSCNDTNKGKSPEDIIFQEDINQVPESLEEKSDDGLSYFSKRYKSDIITKLYDEAMSKNAKLKKLNDEIYKMSQIDNDSLSEYSKYLDTNNNYWRTANRHINQLQDSVLKKSTLEIFEALKLKYEANLSDYEHRLITINKKAILLNDKLILMKLFVTQPMIQNYQEKKKPDVKTLENIIKEYDRLIEETKEYTKMIK